ncbi:uncharacterized protein GIQ15_02629 [Arthroderma uncinatum]|uniref:uncharacterized protein n=1 Tax=Arthroderma uncinatum TaxID=74035 RepID=UPI00144AE964|nr:uncharacterized protein GIQ15_02629 [Arthroderma uncinatum]KAF3483305.1 hypothetical protein GIQ15_02629 [Arthroderma uncinatum]
MDHAANNGAKGSGERGSLDLDALAAVISKASSEISAYCGQSGHPVPANTSEGGSAKHAHIIPPDAAESVHQARQTIRNAAYEILLLCSEPSEFLEDHEVNDWVGFMTKFLVPTACQLPEATERWGDTKETNQTALNCAFNTDLTTFEYMESNQASSDYFARYMRSLGKSAGFLPDHILKGFNWESLGEAQVVDVGGSSGQVAILLATNYPRLTIKIMDLPVTTANTQPILDRLEPSVASRVSCVAHDFFKPFPEVLAESTDVYFLRKILHDWPFPSAQIILQNLTTALKPGAVIVIMETILPPSGSIPARAEARLCVRDLIMAETQNSKEREMSDWIELFESVTPKLRLKGYEQPSGSVLTLLVVEVDK